MEDVMGRRGLACPVQSRELCRTDLLRAGGPGQPAAMLGPAVFTRAAARGQEALSHADALPRKGSGLLCYLSITPERIQVKTVWEPCGALLERKRVPPQALAWCPQLLRVTLFPPASAYFKWFQPVKPAWAADPPRLWAEHLAGLLWAEIFLWRILAWGFGERRLLGPGLGNPQDP